MIYKTIYLPLHKRRVNKLLNFFVFLKIWQAKKKNLASKPLNMLFVQTYGCLVIILVKYFNFCYTYKI